jgi:hypothetical protein
MSRIGARLVCSLGLVLLAGLLSAASAGASVVFGSDLQNSANLSTCSSSPFQISCTLAISDLGASNQAPGGARAPSDGVIVSWRVKVGAGASSHEARLRVIHGTKGSGGEKVTLPAAAGVYSFPARVSVQAGDELGIDVLDTSEFSEAVVASNSGPAAIVDLWSPVLGEGEERTPTQNDVAGTETLINATLEPDADHDGYGDETQDACPTVANNGGPCPPPPPPAPIAPAFPLGTKITKGPKGKVKGSKAKFKFKSEPAGAKFECKLDRKKFKPCASPKTYKGLAPGKHTFSVRAVTASGAVDSSPAKRAFTLEP